MTTLERYAVTIATSADRPKKSHAASKYLDNLEGVTRAAVQPMPREIKHRDQKPVMRRLDAGNNDEIGGEIGAKILAALRRKGISTVPLRRRETTDNIGRAV
jgi:hypothetical protein